MKDRHLRLVVINNFECTKNSLEFKYLRKLKDFIENIFVSKNEKIYILKDILIKLYRDYEESTGIIDEPYFVKAEKRICKMIRDNKINYYYNRLKKFKRNDF